MAQRTVVFTSSRAKRIEERLIKTICPKIKDIAMFVMDIIKEPYDNSHIIIEFLDYLNDPILIKRVVNKPIRYDNGNMTMLMCAIYMLKPKIVEKLLELGADPYYRNENGHGIAYYWYLKTYETHEEQIAAAKIAEILLKYNISFHCHDTNNNCYIIDLVIKSNLFGLLYELKRIGYMCADIEQYCTI